VIRHRVLVDDGGPVALDAVRTAVGKYISQLFGKIFEHSLFSGWYNRGAVAITDVTSNPWIHILVFRTFSIDGLHRLLEFICLSESRDKAKGVMINDIVRIDIIFQNDSSLLLYFLKDDCCNELLLKTMELWQLLGWDDLQEFARHIFECSIVLSTFTP
jgi:hypothetical protein